MMTACGLVPVCCARSSLSSQDYALRVVRRGSQPWVWFEGRGLLPACDVS